MVQRQTWGDKELWELAEAQKRSVGQGDGQVTMRLENSRALLGSRNYVQLVLHLKHVQVYTASPSAVFLSPMALLASVCAHMHSYRHFYNYFITWSHKCCLISTQMESMTSPECVNCVESLFRTSACVHITCWCVGTEGKWACMCLRDNECYYNRQNPVRERSITLLAAVTQ